MSKSLGSSLVSLGRFVMTSVSKQFLVTALWTVFLSFLIVLMQFLLLYHYKDWLTHVLVLCTIYYNTEVLRNSKLSLLSAVGISYWERSALWPLCHPRGRSMAYSLLPARSLAGEESLLLTKMSTDFDSDIILDFLAHHDSSEEGTTLCSHQKYWCTCIMQSLRKKKRSAGWKPQQRKNCQRYSRETPLKLSTSSTSSQPTSWLTTMNWC